MSAGAIETGPPRPGPTGTAGAAVAVRGLTHQFETPTGTLTVLDGLDLAVDAGGYVALTGRSGAGKSTLLTVLGGLERPQHGQVTVGGHDLDALRGDGLAAFRRATVGFVFQHFGLLGALTASENVELALTLAGTSRARRRKRAAELLEAVGLADRSRHRPMALSGGELQRVAIARALANEPRLVLADEPTGNLDEDSTDRVLDLLGAVTAARGCTLIVVTHNRAVAARAQARYRLDGGILRREVGA
jgi:putative ABC transport system ATP-binding protein